MQAQWDGSTHESSDGNSYGFRMLFKDGFTCMVNFSKAWADIVISQAEARKEARRAYDETTKYNPPYMASNSNINKSGFLGMSTASTQPTQASQPTQPTQPTNPSARRGTSVSAQLSGLFGGDASAPDATTDDDAARASKVPKKTSTDTATPAAPEASGSSAAAKKTQAAQSLGQSMKSMLTGARGKAAPKGKTMAAPSAPKDVATTDKTDKTDKTDIVPDDPMDDA